MNSIKWNNTGTYTNEYTLYKPPSPAGYWLLYAGSTPHTAFSMYHKPTDEQIKNTEELLGWTWRDA